MYSTIVKLLENIYLNGNGGGYVKRRGRNMVFWGILIPRLLWVEKGT